MAAKIHFIGIGGIGMSALARYYASEGFVVSGSDDVDSDLLSELKREGMKVMRGSHARNVTADMALVVYSAAVPKDNIERRIARDFDIPQATYAEALGRVQEGYFAIAVSGSHGKSTTTALTALACIAARMDPTVIVGTKLKEFKGKNFRHGKSNYLIFEADEWSRSFLHYHPDVILLTNIDNEHLDTYGDIAGVERAFGEYVRNLKRGGYLIANWADVRVRRIAENAARERSDTGVIFYNRSKFQKHPLGVPGVHNQENAEAAWQLAKLLGAPRTAVTRAFKSFRGAWRRMERLRPAGAKARVRALLYSDYAHHPTEIKATLAALRGAYPKRHLTCVFEPHQLDRLNRLFKDFAGAFSDADTLVFLPAYQVAGREKRKKKRGAKEKDAFALAQAVPKRGREVFYATDFREGMKLLKGALTDPKSVIVFMGAGQVDAAARKAFDIA
jgi:UDP-N-acetylmuramate--alanine ligase